MEKGFWKKVFTNTCIYFAVLLTVILIIYTVTADNSIYEPTFSVFRTLMMLGFCIIFAIANRILASEKINGWIKLLSHFALTAAAFFIFIYAPMVADGKYRAGLANVTYKPLNLMVVIGLFIFVYAIAYGIYFAIATRKAKKKNVKSEYRSLYKDKISK